MSRRQKLQKDKKPRNGNQKGGVKRPNGVVVANAVANPVVSRPLVSGVPKSRRITMRHWMRIAFNSGAGSGTNDSQGLRGNGAQDPDSDGAGSGPALWTDFQSMYGRYVVHAATCRVTCVNLVDGAIDLSIHASVSPSAVGVTAVHLQPRGTAMLVGPHGSCRDVVDLSLTARTADLYDKVNIKDESDLVALTSGIPTSQWYFVIQASDQLGEALNCYVQITTDYDIEFFLPSSRVLT
jgi:hypothetical protein